MNQRKSIPVDVRTIVLTQAGFRCAVPTCRTILALDLHHIVELSQGGRDSPDNLVALCPTCHALHHRGSIPIESIRAWKLILFSMNEVLGKRVIDDLLLLELQPSDNLIDFSGDALIHFGPLVAARLIEYGTTRTTTSKGTEFESYWLDLTTKGRSFLQAYRSGDLASAQRLVSLSPLP